MNLNSSQRFQKISCFNNHLFNYYDNYSHKIRLMQSVTIPPKHNRHAFTQINKLLSINHSCIAHFEAIYQSMEQVSFEIDQLGIESKRYTYLQVQNNFIGPLVQYVSILHKEQIIKIYDKLKEAIQQLHQKDIIVSITLADIYIDDRLHPIICPSIKSIYEFSKCIRQYIRANNNEKYKIQTKQRNLEELDIAIYELILKVSIRQQLQRSDFKSKKVMMNNIKSMLESYFRTQKIEVDNVIIDPDNRQLHDDLEKSLKSSKPSDMIQNIGIENNCQLLKNNQIEQESVFIVIPQINRSTWKKLQKQSFYKFLIDKEKILRAKNLGMNQYFYEEMAKTIVTRTANQCKNCFFRIKDKAVTFEELKQNAQIYMNSSRS